MKKLSIIIFAACLASCSTYSPVVNFIDYSTYNTQGVFLTESNSVSFEYEPIGSVNVLLYSGQVESKPAVKNEKVRTDPIYGAPAGRANYQDATIQEALRIAVDHAVRQEANAIINLQYSFVPSGKGTPPGWYVSGMAVKR